MCNLIIKHSYYTEGSMSVDCKNAPDEPSAAALPKMIGADEGKHHTVSL